MRQGSELVAEYAARVVGRLYAEDRYIATSGNRDGDDAARLLGTSLSGYTSTIKKRGQCHRG